MDMGRHAIFIMNTIHNSNSSLALLGRDKFYFLLRVTFQFSSIILGYLTILELTTLLSFSEVARWKGHGFEAWTGVFDSWSPSVRGYILLPKMIANSS